MRSNTIDDFSKNEEEVFQILGKIGLKPNEARVLVIFLRGKELTSREVERYADLRQPEVSVALTALSKRDWICTSSSITQSKGRPIKIFSLAQPAAEIIYQIKAGIQGEFSKQIAYVDRVNDLIDGSVGINNQEPIIEADPQE